MNGEFLARVDFAYPQIRLAIEAHSWRWHTGRQGWDKDVERFNRLQDCGWRVLYVTKRNLEAGEDEVIARIRRSLGGQLPGLAG